MKQRKKFFLFSCILSTILLSGTISPSLTLKAHEEIKAGTTTNYITEDGNHVQSFGQMESRLPKWAVMTATLKK